MPLDPKPPVPTPPPPLSGPAALGAREQWLASALGQELLAAEAELLGPIVEGVFGFELLQLGCWGAPRALLAASRTRRQTLIAESGGPHGADIVARLSALPVQSGSVDAVLLPHTLEFEADPQAVVREADRVLSGEGQLLVLGFAPMSLWGLRAAASRSGFPPGMQQLLPEGRLRDWLALLGYEISYSRHYLYCRPWSTGERSKGRRILRRGLGNPLPAAAYVLKARKRVYTLTPIRPRLRERRKILGTLPEPTSRTGG